jgi:hypothetical protein
MVAATQQYNKWVITVLIPAFVFINGLLGDVPVLCSV